MCFINVPDKYHGPSVVYLKMSQVVYKTYVFCLPCGQQYTGGVQHLTPMSSARVISRVSSVS